MTSHGKARTGAAALVLAAALFATSPSYGFWFLFGYPHHTNSRGHYDGCCGPDYGYIYHHENTHDEPYFREQTGSEHVAAHHRASEARRDKRDDRRPAHFRCEDDDCHGHRSQHRKHHH